jgi:hypothetical protein
MVALHGMLLTGMAWLAMRRLGYGANLQRLFWAGWAAHLAAGIAVGLAHGYFYAGRNDTEAYWQAANQLWAAIYQDPHGGAAVLLRWFAEGDTHRYAEAFRTIPFFEDHRAFNFVRLLVPLVPLTGGSYYGMGLYLSAVGFAGCWALFRVLCSLAPNRQWWWAGVCLFWPSLTFWTSGLLKEPWTFGMLGLAVGGGYSMLATQTVRLRPALIVVGCSVLGYVVKPYPVLALWACAPIVVAGMLVTRSFWAAHKTKALLSLGALGLLTVVILAFSPFNLERVFAEAFYLREILMNAYTPDALQATSYFELSDYQPTLAWALSKIPQATFATLFRPLPWEAHNPQALAAGLENLFLLGLTAYLMATARYQMLRQAPRGMVAIAVFLLVYSIPYAYFLGLATPFFGTLIRYKVYVLPFFLSGVLLLWHCSRKHLNNA